MQDNPFDDPSVQSATYDNAAPVAAAAANDPAVQSAVWEASKNAYSTGSDPKSTIMSDSNVQKAVVGAAIGHYTGSNPNNPPPPPASTQNHDDGNAYESGGWDPEQNQPKGAPEEKTFMGAVAGCCAAFSARLPLRYCLMFLGVFMITGAILDFALKFKGALDIIVNLYLIFFGILIIFIEWPRMAWNSRVQEGILYWSYFLARLWGRALLYVFLAILCVADGKSWPKVLVGLYCFFLTFVMYFVAYQAAKKMKRMNIFVSRGTEGEQRIEMIKEKFKELDMASMGHIGAEAIQKVAEQADRELSFSEREAIVRFFNPNFENDITLDEWLTGFDIAQTGLRML